MILGRDETSVKALRMNDKEHFQMKLHAQGRENGVMRWNCCQENWIWIDMYYSGQRSCEDSAIHVHCQLQIRQGSAASKVIHRGLKNKENKAALRVDVYCIGQQNFIKTNILCQ